MITKSEILSIQDLTHALSNANDNRAFEGILKKTRLNYRTIEHLCFWDPERYSRINIGKGENYELVLICWENDQKSSIHRHDSKQAWTYVLKGELTEKTFKTINGSENYDLMDENTLNHRAFSCLINQTKNYHQLINSNNGRTVSLHLYVN